MSDQRWLYTTDASRTIDSSTPSSPSALRGGFDPAWLVDYDDIERIGEGGMGVVFRARNTRLNRVEAIKVAIAGRFAGPKEIARFRFEAESAAGLAHPNIVSVYGSGEIGGVPFIAFQWIDGGTLDIYLPELRRDAKKTSQIMAKIARAIQHAHAQGILHRDLKPTNILVDAAGEPMITDFGLAKRSGAKDLTETGRVVGTPAYMAPEQARGERQMTTAIDIYALGAILYEVLTGRPPFEGESIGDVLRRTQVEPPVAPKLINSNANADLEAICLKCLQKRPADRYPSAMALAEELERVAAGRPIESRNPGIVDWLNQAMRQEPEVHIGYAWQVLVWFAGILLTVHSCVGAITAFGGSTGLVWIAHGIASAGMAVVVWWYLVRKFHLLPNTERHSMMVAVGHIVANIALMLAYVPLSFELLASTALGVYPPLFVTSGYGLFVIGTTHWGRFYLFGVAVFALVPVAAALPQLSPFLYGTTVAAVMLYWAYSLKFTFGHKATRVA